MVGYNPNNAERLSHVEYAAAGAVSGAVSRALFQPLDVVKIRFQLQSEPIKHQSSSKYHGLSQAVGRIMHEEGVRAFWKGHVPAQALSISFGMTQYASFELFTYFVWKTLPQSWTTEKRTMTHTLCGAGSGCIASAVIHPLDVIRTRFIAQGEPKIYTSMTSAVQLILRNEGVGGFYRGIVPAITVVGPQMGLQFGFYSFFTSLWNKGLLANTLPGFVESFICGSGAGFMSKIIVHPFDVIKKRLQVQGFEEARVKFGAVKVYDSAWNCFTKSLEEEGIRGLFKGLTPGLIKAALVAGSHLLVYEQLCALFVQLRKS